jgi:hypothetical protein
VTVFEVFDDGNESFFDVYEFTAFDPDEPAGRGLIQDEYADYLKSR